MDNHICHITICGAPACKRDADPIDMLNLAAMYHIELSCSFHDRSEAERTAAFMARWHRKVEVVDGPCPGYAAPE